VSHQLVELVERAGIAEQGDSFAGGQLAGLVLAGDALGAAAVLGAFLERGESIEGCAVGRARGRRGHGTSQ
jgi:hypothetical protein